MTELLPRVRLELAYELTCKPTRQPHSAIFLRGGAEVLQTKSRGRTCIEAIACYSLKQAR